MWQLPVSRWLISIVKPTSGYCLQIPTSWYYLHIFSGACFLGHLLLGAIFMYLWALTFSQYYRQVFLSTIFRYFSVSSGISQNYLQVFLSIFRYFSVLSSGISQYLQVFLSTIFRYFKVSSGISQYYLQVFLSIFRYFSVSSGISQYLQVFLSIFRYFSVLSSGISQYYLQVPTSWSYLHVSLGTYFSSVLSSGTYFLVLSSRIFRHLLFLSTVFRYLLLGGVRALSSFSSSAGPSSPTVSTGSLASVGQTSCSPAPSPLASSLLASALTCVPSSNSRPSLYQVKVKATVTHRQLKKMPKKAQLRG